MKNTNFLFAAVTLFVLFCFVSIPSWAKDSTVICSGHPDYKPFMWQHNNAIVGVGPELIRRIFTELGKDFTIKYTGSWARVQEMVRQNKVDFLVGAYHNDQRREYMIYLTPYARDPISVFVKKDQSFVFNNRNDLIGKKGVTMHGDSFGENLDAFIIDKLQIDRVYDSTSLFKKILFRQRDYILWGDFPAGLMQRKSMAGK